MKDLENVEELSREVSTLRIVAKRDGKEPYTAKIPVKGDTFSLVLPDGYINWPKRQTISRLDSGDDRRDA
jgi:hypothetical protein